MKKLFVLAFVVILVLVLLHRQRVFVRDPLATVYAPAGHGSTDEVKQPGVQVYINYSNDVLLLKDNPGGYALLVQHWNRMPGTPARLRCIHWMACLTDADHAEMLAARPYDAKMHMSDRAVVFVDPKGVAMRVELR